MKKLIYILPIFALLFASCENYYMKNQLGYETTIEDVRNFTYTLTDADYATLLSACDSANYRAALALDPKDSSYVTILQAVKINKYFSDSIITPDFCIPALLQNIYPQLSKGTICEVFYKSLAETPAYAADFKYFREYTPETPISSVDSIPSVLAANLHPLFQTSDYKFIVNYNYYTALLYQFADGVFSPYTNTISIYVLSQEDYALFDNKYVPSPETNIPTFLLKRFPYAETETKKLVFFNTESGIQYGEYIFDGTNWNNGETIEESMSFELKDSWKANTSVFLTEPFIGHGQGDFVIQDVFLEDPLTYVWYYSSSYGMCASGYKSNASWKSESWLVSPKVKMKKAKNPALIFDQAFNKALNFTEECTVLVSTDYKGDVTTCTWKELPWNTNEDGTLNVPAGTSWLFQSSGEISLSEWVGKTIHIGFRYTSATGVSGTWEIQNVLVHETAVEE